MKIFTYIKDRSSRVKKKNFQKIGDLELWKHLLYEFSEYMVFVDTDSSNVIGECQLDDKLKNVVAYPRHYSLVEMEEDPNNKLSPSLLMVDNFLNTYVDDLEEKIVLTHVTSPFLRKETVESAIAYLDKGYEFVHSVYSIQDFAWYGSNFSPLNFNPKVVQRTQDIEKVYFSNGAFFMFTKKMFKKYKNRLGRKNYFYELGSIESIEIDTEEDLKLARTVYKGNK